jgi:hypothetical protein
VRFEGKKQFYWVNGNNQSTLLIAAKTNKIEVCLDSIDHGTFSDGTPTYNFVGTK